MYEKNQLLGTNKSGSTPKNGPKTIHKATEPLAHTGPIYDSADHGDTSIARKGAPKKLADVAVHSGQHARSRDGALVTGQTMTSLANAPDASGARPLDPTVDGCKVGKAVPPSFGQRSRTQVGEGVMAPGVAHAVSANVSGLLHADRHATADKIINEGVLAHGDPNHPRHPANLRRR